MNHPIVIIILLNINYILSPNKSEIYPPINGIIILG